MARVSGDRARGGRRRHGIVRGGGYGEDDPDRWSPPVGERGRARTGWAGGARAVDSTAAGWAWPINFFFVMFSFSVFSYFFYIFCFKIPNQIEPVSIDL